MQRFNQKLVSHLRSCGDFRLIRWGRSQALLPLFLLFTLLKTAALRVGGKIDRVYLGDGLMSPLGVFFKKVLGLKVAVSIHGRDIAFAFPGYLTVVPWALRRLDRVICVSSQLKGECRRFGVGEEILTAIPNGVDVEDFAWREQVSPREFLGWSLGDRTVLITVGRLVTKKGVDRFIRDILPEIVAAEPRVLYLVVGGGPLLAEIDALIAEKGLQDHVLLAGDVPMDDPRLKALYNAADIFVMPNVLIGGDIEGFGIVALEGGAAGLPVVASRLQGIQEAIVPGKNGILLPWDDPDAFVRTIVDLIRNPGERKKLGESARRFVAENYSWSAIARRYWREFMSLQE
ncbi:MAG: glycosyltransferase family 4 protein [Candidatus Aureabacteria bacterium]|nr:glycosyltransferase family 4 protein [Candidatus Auribacterota bacterium]